MANVVRRAFVVGLMCSGIAAASLANQYAWGQDAQRGAHVFRKCKVCHTVDPAEPLKLAPPLAGVLGRPAGTIPGYEYSDSMQAASKAGLIWSKEALNYFLDRPDTFMPGTYMTFAGLEQAERQDVIAYLEVISYDDIQSPKRRAQETGTAEKFKFRGDGK